MKLETKRHELSMILKASATYFVIVVHWFLSSYFLRNYRRLRVIGGGIDRLAANHLARRACARLSFLTAVSLVRSSGASCL